MKVEMIIDETEFKKLLDGQLSKLSDETIQNIILESIKEYFVKDNYENIEDIFIQKKRNHYNFDEKCSTEFFQGLVRDCDYSKLQDLVDAAIDNLVNNNDRILKDLFIEAIADKLDRTYSFRDSVKNVLIKDR